MRPVCLIVDDSADIRFAVRDFLEVEGFEVSEAADLDGCIRVFAARRPNVVVLDFMLGADTALDVIPRLREHDDTVPIIVLTAHASIDRAVEAIKLGAANFLSKPVELPALATLVGRLVAQQRDTRRRLLRDSAAATAPDPFAGEGTEIKRLRREALLSLQSSLPVLLLGESGTGKTLAARWMHQNSSRAKEPFVVLNCAAIPRDLLEAELFGYQKGAFSGALGAKPGLMELADRGTLFLDEIGDLDLTLQPKLLSAIEENRFRRLGDVRERDVDVRFICATHQDLRAHIATGRFRADLYYRISAMPMQIPSLRERPQDVLAIAAELLRHLERDLKRPPLRLTPDAQGRLRQYTWPGNIRELRNVLERAAIHSPDGIISGASLSLHDTVPGMIAEATSSMALREVERGHIEKVLRVHRGHVESAAKALEVPRSTLYQRIKELGIALHDA